MKEFTLLLAATEFTPFWERTLASIIPERSEGLLFHQASDSHRVSTTTEIRVQRRQNGSLLRSLPSKSAFGTLFSHARCRRIRVVTSRNQFGKKLGLCYRGDRINPPLNDLGFKILRSSPNVWKKWARGYFFLRNFKMFARGYFFFEIGSENGQNFLALRAKPWWFCL